LITSRTTLVRFVQTVAVLFRYRIVQAALPWRRGRLDPVQLRLALERLGGSWIKLGQMLAMRFDLLPSDFCFELFKLLNEVKPFPYDQVREVIRQELGGYPEQFFLDFEPKPFAAASIGQVHRAVLPSGRPVAVKVQRPDARQIFAADVQLMYAVSGILDRVGLFGKTKTRWVIDEFAKWTSDELDYLIEARQGVLLRDNAEGDRLQSPAHVWGDYSTSRVLTLDLMEGVPLIEIMNAVRARDQVYLDQMRAAGHDLERIVQHLDWNMLNQIHAYGFFHADLHPANLFVLPGDAIGYVDFGIVGKLSGETRRSLTRYAWLFFQGETDHAVAELMRWVAPASLGRVGAARSELVRIHDEFLVTVGAAGQVSTKGAGVAFAVGVLDVVRRNGIALAPNVITYFRTLITADSIRFELAPEYDLRWHVQRFFKRLIARQARDLVSPRAALIGAYDIGVRANRLLAATETQLLTVSNVEARLGGLQERVKSASKRLLMLVLLVVAGVVVLHALDLNPNWRSEGMLPHSAREWLHWVVFGVLLFIIFGIGIQAYRLWDADRATKD
jgi:ubiquinone biosynthesis protein